MNNENKEVEETEYVVSDFQDTIEVILESDELTIDDKLVTKLEKDIIRHSIEDLIDKIRKVRKGYYE